MAHLEEKTVSSEQKFDGKIVKLFVDKAELEDSYLTVNFRAAGAVLKQNVNKMKQALESATAEEMAAYTKAAQNGEKVLVKGFDEAYDPAIFTVMSKTKEGIVSAECQNKTVVALDVVLTDELIKEGTVRDVVRQCQLVRKEAGYEVEQRVVMAIASDSDFVLATLTENKAYMADELLADELLLGEAIDNADYTKDCEAADAKVTISVKKS